MSSNIKSSRLAVALLSASTLAASFVAGGFTAPKALSVPPAPSQNQLITCVAGTDVGPCVLNGAGATFPFPLFFEYFPTLFPDQVNYAAIGSGGGINAFLSQVPPAAPPAATTVPGPFSFASTDAPVTQAQREVYYFGTDRVAGPVFNNPIVSPTIQSGRRELGYGPLVQLPFVTGGVSISYHVPGVADGAPLTRAQECGLFNGTLTTFPGTTVPVVGARRTDSSGTTFIISQHLNSVCSNGGSIASGGNGTGSNLWLTTTSQSRGFGQVSVNEIPGAQPNNLDAVVDPGEDICDLPFTTVSPAPAGQRTNTVCWPSTFLSGSGNPGVAAQIRGTVQTPNPPVSGTAGTPTLTPDNPTGTTIVAKPPTDGRFGYVEFAVSVQYGPDAGRPFTIPAGLANPDAGNPDEDILIASVQNRAGVSVLPTATQVANALDTVADSDPRSCTITLNEPDPTDGYPISGVNYLLFYGDNNPDVLPSGVTPATRAGAFNNQGLRIRDRGRQFFSTLVSSAPARQLFEDLGYAPLPATLRSTTAGTAVSCIQSVTNGTNNLDPTP